MKYAFIREHTGQASIRVQCEVYGVSRSGYYAWQRRQDHPSQRQLARLARVRLDQLVSAAFAARKGRSGAVGLTLDLDERGHKYNRKTVAASMKRQGLVAKAAKKHKATTDSDHNLPVAPNHLEQDFKAESPQPEVGLRHYLQCARLPALAWRCPPGHEHVRNTYGQSKEAIWSIWPLFAAKEREPKRR